MRPTLSHPKQLRTMHFPDSENKLRRLQESETRSTPADKQLNLPTKGNQEENKQNVFSRDLTIHIIFFLLAGYPGLCGAET